MFRSDLKTCAFLPLLALIVAAAFSPSTQPQTVQPAAEQTPAAPNPTPTPAPAADEATLNHHRWGAVTIFHGLPSDRINAIIQDAEGLLWFGTDNGLVRYDGRNVEPFPGSLPSRRILALALDSRGALWVGTDAGAARLQNNIPALLPETRGRAVTGIASAPNEIAIVTAPGQILRYRLPEGNYSPADRIDRNPRPLLESTNQHEQPGQPGQPAKPQSLAAAAFTRSGELLVGSSGRGALIDKGGELRQAFTRSPYFVSAIFTGSDKIWLGEKANPQSGALWVLANGATVKTAVKTGAINALSGGGEAELWVGTNKQGAELLKIEGDGVRQIEHLTFENTAGGLRSNQINAVFRDREGIVWFGTDRGVCRYDRDSFRAENISNNPQSNFIRSLLQTSAGETYLGANRGLFRLVRGENAGDRGAWAEAGELQGHAVYALSEDAAGTVWAGTDSGVFLKLKEAPAFTHFSTAPELRETGLENPGAGQPVEAQLEPAGTPVRESVRALTVFRGAIYVAIFGAGIEKFEATPEGGKRTSVLDNKTAKGAICFAAEGDRALWFGTSDGELVRFDGEQTSSYSIPKKQSSDPAIRVIRIVSDEVGGDRVWLGTSQGLYLRDGDSLREIKANIDVRDLLVQRDDHGQTIIWLATPNSGLIKYLPGAEIEVRFDTEQGLTSEQIFCLAASKAEIWIGTNRGLVRHRPSPVEPRIQATRLVADRIYEAKALTGDLQLSYPQRHFVLEVSGIGTRTFRSQFQYEFLLQDGHGKQLSKLSTHEPSYTTPELNPGLYTIAARAISRDLVYSAPLNVRVRIGESPFPWLPILLASLLGIAATAAVWAFRQQRRLARVNQTMEETNSELHETRLRLANETEAERSRIARDLHDQTLSDLRHLLVLTDQMRAANNDVSPSQLRRKIESISSEIRHICEDLSPSALENIGFLPALEWALNNVVAGLPAEQKFGYEFICNPDLEDRLQLSQIEKIQLYRIVQEALNNIARHARAREVKLVVRGEGAGELLIVIEDDGIGFDGTPLNPTGYGIANIRSRADLIGARVKWKKMNPGCRFEVTKAGVVS